ncbi:peptidylprolyl isomerase [Roseicyclus sp. F158]|uniref:Parvulin-like PPIase n=1 Tax=Tropicimonas omnivorans TaxID=3075590 RepID=A0ABU3DCZ6_9RHOB|nr:peptidylprolyl isomerase [Roseicyclus sp. F158]MDT0681572.1 peptidylprolyl isomerase [Roseicyclus sp. F158]
MTRVITAPWTAGLLTLALAMPAAAQDETAEGASTGGDVTADTVVATVNGTEITVGNMIVARSTLPQQYQQLPPEVLFQGVLDQLVQQTVLSQEADEPSRLTELTLANQRSALMAGEVLLSVAEDAVTDEAIQEAYDAQYSDAEPTREWNASHILVETEEEAQTLKTELEEGADFATLAQERSTGPSGPSGGELGWFGPGMMVPEFEEAVTGMEEGDVSDPVQTQFGWHVVKLNETRMQDAPAVEDVRAELAAQVEQNAVQQYVADAVSGADVEESEAEIDPSILGDLNLVQE